MPKSEVITRPDVVVVLVQDGIVERVYSKDENMTVVVVDKDVFDEESSASVWEPFHFSFDRLTLKPDAWQALEDRVQPRQSTLGPESKGGGG